MRPNDSSKPSAATWLPPEACCQGASRVSVLAGCNTSTRIPGAYSRAASQKIRGKTFLPINILEKEAVHETAASESVMRRYGEARLKKLANLRCLNRVHDDLFSKDCEPIDWEHRHVSLRSQSKGNA